ncbi:hypothetical protein C7U57_08390 [Pseudomonas sp. R9.37]|nr:hypothetical protein C7U57_08390 [Pseudomonas sp. R9.37]
MSVSKFLAERPHSRASPLPQLSCAWLETSERHKKGRHPRGCRPFCYRRFYSLAVNSASSFSWSRAN